MENIPGRRIRGRYLLALVLIILFTIALFVADTVAYILIKRFAPSYVSYIPYIVEATRILLGILGAYIVYKILLSVVELRGKQKHDFANTEVIKLFLRVLFWFAVIAIVLTGFGISLSEALAGGAIGGIIIGLAVQTVFTSIISGFLISSGKTLLPGDIVILHSLSWGDLLCKVVKVNILLTEVITHDNNRVKVPNTLLATSTVFTHLKNSMDYSYPFQVIVNADVSATILEKKANEILKSKFYKLKLKIPRIYLYQKTGTTNVFNAVLSFNSFDDLNGLINLVNTAFDDAYWSIKKT
ncbi:MAG: mechanosensitive ion channel family protein [Candidatus Micrarchaeaceae archaeon]